MQGVDDRPDRAGPNSAFDIFGPRLTAFLPDRRKERACRASTRTADGEPLRNGEISSTG
jgi:hypothetical protein